MREGGDEHLFLLEVTAEKSLRELDRFSTRRELLLGRRNLCDSQSKRNSLPSNCNGLHGSEGLGAREKERERQRERERERGTNERGERSKNNGQKIQTKNVF
jgi:hypothetical protein